MCVCVRARGCVCVCVHVVIYRLETSSIKLGQQASDAGFSGPQLTETNTRTELSTRYEMTRLTIMKHKRLSAAIATRSLHGVRLMLLHGARRCDGMGYSSTSGF